MMTPSPRPAPRLLPIFGLALGLFPVLSLSAQLDEVHQPTGSAYVELASPDRVTDLSGFPDFSELYTHPIERNLTGGATDYWVLRGVRSLAFEKELAEGEEDTEDTFDLRYVARYSTFNRATRRMGENGILGWRLQGTAADGEASRASTVGFIRSTARPSSLPATEQTGYFTGASGNLAWEAKAANRTALLTLSGAAYDPDRVFEDWNTLVVGQAGITVDSFDFHVPDTTPPLFWRFTATTPTDLGNGVYFDVILRFDERTAEEIPVSDLEGDPDPQDFWQRVYFLFLIDDQDSDRDGIPDFRDLTESVATFPWYADYDGNNGWYYSIWMGTWVYSDRTTDWDYSLKLGWIWAHPSHDRDSLWIWVHAGDLGWMWTSQRWHPVFYRDSTGDYLYQTAGGNGTAEFYNYTTDDRETVNF